MPSSATTRNRFEKQGTGENTNTWGAKLNSTGLDLIDEALDGYESIAITGDYTLTATNYTSDQSRKRFLKFTGTTAASITLPAVSKLYFVWNATSATLTFTTGGATTTTVAAGAKRWIASDGSGVYVDTSASDAATSATEAATSASSASSSASAASTSESNAATSATNAATSATNAATSETNAAASASDAAQSATEAAASSGIPSVTGNSGKYLTTDGSTTSWGTVASGITALTGDVTASGSGSVAASIATGAVTNAHIRSAWGNSVIGRSAATAGNVDDIRATSDHQVLRRSGTALGFGAIDLAQSAAVTGTLAVGNGGTGATTSTGTGSVVLSASPTLTGTAALASATFSGTVRGAAGSVTAPAYAFSADTNTGIYSSTADTFNIATGGVLRLSLSTTAITATLPVLVTTGSAAAPGVAFSDDTDTGIARPGGANTLSVVAGGSEMFRVATNGVAVYNTNFAVSGGFIQISATAPATATSTGSAGSLAYDSSYLYVCTAANTWKRVGLASW